MKSAILGKKIGMSQIFTANGQVVPVTVVEAGPCVVSQIKTNDKDGYEAVQLAFSDIKEKKLTTKGHGFSGVIKRWNAHRLPMSHGAGPVHREPGSLSANSTPSRVFKNRKLPGQYGNEKVTIQNLEIAKVDIERNLLLIKGAIPGAKGSVVTISSAVKAN